MRIHIVIIATFFVFISQVNAAQYHLMSTTELHDKEVQIKAMESLTTLSELVVMQKNYEEMGFKSPADLKRMTLGTPLQVFIVRLDHLKEYKSGEDLNNLLSGGNHVMYPVLVDEQVRSSVTLAEKENNWSTVSFGNPTLIKLLTNIRTDSAKTSRLPHSSYFVVQVPALNFYFLGYRINNKLMLVSLIDDSQFGFKKGISMPADDVFSAILPAAKQHDGLPR